MAIAKKPWARTRFSRIPAKASLEIGTRRDRSNTEADRTSISVWLQNDLLAELDERAGEAGITRQSLVRLAIHHLLKKARDRPLADFL